MSLKNFYSQRFLFAVADDRACLQLVEIADRHLLASGHAFFDLDQSAVGQAGFDDALSIPEMKDRVLAGSDTIDVLAAYLPAEVARNFQQGQDVAFYTKVFVVRASRDEDVPADLIPTFAERARAGETPDQRAKLAEIERQTGIAITQLVNLGVFDETPASFSSMLISSVTTATGSGNFLLSATSIVARKRFVVVQAIRRFEQPADRQELEAFTKNWVRAIIAANP